MKFYPRRRRTAPAIIIISLIDVLIVMLVFLLVTTGFKNQPSIKIVLPDTASAPKPGAGGDKPPVIVTVHNDEPHFYLGARPVTEDQLVESLKDSVARDAGVNVAVRADREVPLRLVFKLFDLTAKSGVNVKNMKWFAQKPGQN